MLFTRPVLAIYLTLLALAGGLLGCATPGAHLRAYGGPTASMPSLAELAPGSEAAALAQVTAAEERELPIELVLPRTGMRFRLIPPGSFLMGSPEEEPGRYADEGPQRSVRIKRAFYLGVLEVTQGQWQQVMGSNPSHFAALGPQAPVDKVSWTAAQDFADRLADLEDMPEGSFRLPLEAEWEYACRAGTTAATYGGDLELGPGRQPKLERLAWIGLNSGTQTQPVGQKTPNAWGLHDMLGNVWEWCDDTYGLYPHAKYALPSDAPKRGQKVLRGGSFLAGARAVRAAHRYHQAPASSDGDTGLRLVLQLNPPIPEAFDDPFFPGPRHHWWLREMRHPHFMGHRHGWR